MRAAVVLHFYQILPNQRQRRRLRREPSSTRYVPVSNLYLRKEATPKMYRKPYLSALACALTLGLATSGYAQKARTAQAQLHSSQKTSTATTSRARKARPQAQASAGRNIYPVTIAFPDGYVPSAPRLITPADMFHTVVPVQVTPRSSGGPQSRAITNQAIYREGDTVATKANFNNTFVGNYDAAGDVITDALDDIYLPAGLAKGAGVTLTGFTAVASSIDNTATAYGRLTIYDSIDQLNAINGAVNKLAMYDFEIDNLVPGSATLGTTGVQGSFTIPAASQIALTHDLGSTGNERYGVAVTFYTDATRTAISHSVADTFVYDDGVVGDGSPSIGTSLEGFFTDVDYSGNYQTAGKAGYSDYFGGSNLSNFFLELDGTSANNLTYTVDGFDGSDGTASLGDGGVTFSGLTSSAQKPVLFIEFASTNPSVKPFFFSYRALNIADVKNNRGIVTGERGDVLLTGIAPDTYNVTFSSPGFAPTTVSNLDLTSANYHTLNLTLVPLTGPGTTVTLETVTGNIALEGVNDLSTINAAAPLGGFDVQFRTPGTTTTVLEITNQPVTITPGSANGSYSISGIPDGTYDVWIKGNKNLAVLSQGVVINSTTPTAPDVLLPAGDANNDNSVDSTDFGLLIGAFNTTGAVAGSGYDPTVDFNFDGSVDSTDFGLLIGEFNNVGPK